MKVLRAIAALEPKNVTRGQFVGYLKEPGVSPDSKTETFAALQLEVNSWRWRGVPFYIRAGKCLPETCAEVLARLHKPPSAIKDSKLCSNYLRFRISPDMAIGLGTTVMAAGDDMSGEQVELEVVSHPSAAEMEAYERVLGDAMAGDATLFAREDYVEEAWRIVDSYLKTPTPVFEYAPNTWGPAEAAHISPARGLGRSIRIGLNTRPQRARTSAAAGETGLNLFFALLLRWLERIFEPCLRRCIHENRSSVRCRHRR